MLARRKGSILDIPFILIVVFAFAFMILIGSVILTEFRDINIDKDLGMDTTLIDKGIAALSALDYMFIFATIGLGLVTIVLAFRIDSHPIMFAFSLMLTAFFVIITTFFTNAFVLITEEDTIATIAGDFPLIDAVMKNLPLIITVIAFVVILALYMGRRSEVSRI